MMIAPPALGSERSFQVLSNVRWQRVQADISAGAVRGGRTSVLYVDVDQPPGAFTDAELRVFGDLFDRRSTISTFVRSAVSRTSMRTAGCFS
jgi:hypothetical protein